MSWRDIKASHVGWEKNPISARAGINIDYMCSERRAEADRKAGRVTRYVPGAWADMTLGELANAGEEYWSRCYRIGDKAVDVIKWIMDEAAEGRCPMHRRSGHQTLGAYIPRAERGSSPDA